MKRSLGGTIAMLAALSATGCTLPSRFGPATTARPAPAEIEAFTHRVTAAMDATSSCVSEFMHEHDVPSITPGDVITAALAECRNFFTAHRGALRELILLKLRASQGIQPNDEAEADAGAERSATHFREIVRETGLNVLVVKRSAVGPETAPRRPGDTSPLQISY